MDKKIIATLFATIISLPAYAVWYTPITISISTDFVFRNKIEILSLAVCIFLIGISLIDLLKSTNMKNQSLRYLIFSGTGLLVLLISKLTY